MPKQPLGVYEHHAGFSLLELRTKGFAHPASRAISPEAVAKHPAPLRAWALIQRLLRQFKRHIRIARRKALFHDPADTHESGLGSQFFVNLFSARRIPDISAACAASKLVKVGCCRYRSA